MARKPNRTIRWLIVAIAIVLLIGITSVLCFAADDAASDGIISVSLSLDENIIVKFRTSATNDDGSFLKISHNGKVSKITSNYGGVFSYTDVAPQNIGDELTAALYAKDGSQIGYPVTFSVKSYLKVLLSVDYETSGCESEMKYTAMRELAVNLLNYGSAAQIYTGHNTDALANAGLSDELKALATAPISVNGTDRVVNGDAWVGAGVRFDYRLGIYYVFEAASLDGVVASINGQRVVPEVYDASKNQYIIRYSHFNATNMNDVITAKLVIGGVEQTYAYSIKSYVAAKGGDDSAFAKLVNATYAYGYAAVAYSGDLKFIAPTLEKAGYYGIDYMGYDFTGSAYELIVLPKLNTVDYTVTTTSTASANPVIKTVYTLKSDKLDYSTSISSDSNDCIRVNDAYYTADELSKLNSDGVEVSYDATKGYTFRAKSAQTLDFIAAYGADLTLVGDITVNRDNNNWNHYNNINIGTEESTCNLTVNTENSNNWGIRLEGGADMYIPEGSTMTVNKGKCAYSIFSAAQGSTIVVDGNLTVASIIRLEKEPVLSSEYEYGFLPALYVRRGTVTIQDGQLLSNSVQVGSEKYGYKGNLSITQTAAGTKAGSGVSNIVLNNTISFENRTLAIRYAFVNGNLTLNDATTAGLTAMDIRTNKSAYVDFGSGINVTTLGGYTYLAGTWSVAADYRYAVHTDAKFSGKLSGNAIVCVGVATSNYFINYSDVELKVDGETKLVRVASYTTSSAKRNMATSLLTDNGDGTKSIADISVVNGEYLTVVDSSVALGIQGSFNKAAYSSNEIYYKVIGGHTHKVETKVDMVDSTCSVAGTEAYYVCNCGKFFSDEACTNQIEKPVSIPTKPHNEVDDAATPPSCTDNGLTAGKHCSVCGTVTVPQEIDVALGHLDADSNYICDRTGCGAKLCTNHNVVTDEGYAATCLTDGLTDGKHCSICGEILEAQTVILATGHNEVVDKAVAATCTSTGLTEGKHCDKCDTVLTEQTVIDAIAHKNTTFVELVDATFDKEGIIAHYACPDCGKYYLDVELTKELSSPILPKLSLEKYNSDTPTVTHATNVTVTTYFTLISDEIEYTVSLTSNSILVVNRGSGNIAVSKYNYQKLNTDIVTVTYDDKTGYTYTVAEGYTETGITGQGIRSSGTVVTIIGNVEISGSARFGANNGMIIGTDEKAANVTIACSASDYGFALWDGADLTIAKKGTLTINGSAPISLYSNKAGSVIVVDGVLNVNKGIKIDTNPASNANYEFGFVPALYVRRGTVNCTGQLQTNSLQVGSEKEDEAYGILNLVFNGNNITHSAGTSKNATIRYTFAKGELNLNNTATGKCAMQVDTKNTAQVDIRAGMTISSKVQYGSIVGEWTAGTYQFSIHKDVTWKLTNAGNILATNQKTVNIYYYSTATVKIDGVEKRVYVANNVVKTSSPYPTLSTFEFATVEEGVDYISSSTTVSYAQLGTFTKATTADGKVIYYQVIQ